MTRITVINPNTSDALTATITAAAAAVAPHGVEVVGVRPSVGVASVESHAEEAVASIGVLEQVRAHDADTDAFVVACFGDTGVLAARELSTGPVVGMTEAALTTACLVAHRFVVITMPVRTVAHSERVVRALGLEHRSVVRAVEAPVADLEGGSAHLLPLFADAARTAMQDDGAEAVVLGCAGLADLVGPLQRELGVPVIEGVAAAVGVAAGLLALGVTTSRANTYAPVPELPAFELRQVEPERIEPGRIDAGQIDAGRIDARRIDTGRIDTGRIDTGLTDAGQIDAGRIDAGQIDAGQIDARRIDARRIDARRIDTGRIDTGRARA